ncbi:MAG: chemotaxis protein CheA, partial [Actinobacteria bacterium]
VPIIRIAGLFEVREEDPDPTEGIVVLVGENGSSVGLVASELLGQQQTVIKPLGEGVSSTPGVSGGAIMPDGTVGLILDVSGLVRLAHTEGGE